MFFVNGEKCVGCGLCMEGCPQQAIRMQDGTAFIDQKLCAACGTCRTMCNNNAIYEVEMLEPVAAATATRRQSKTPASFSMTKEFPEGGKKTALVRILAAVAPILLEGLYSLVNQRVAMGKAQGSRWGQRNCGRGRGYRRRRKW